MSIKIRGKIWHACIWRDQDFNYSTHKTTTRYIMQPQRKLRIGYLLFLIIFLLQRQRALLFQQLYHFLITEEEFRLRRRNGQMLLKILAQIKQQNVQRRRRTWVWPRPQNWFKNLLASPALDFLWKEHFRVTRETFEFLCNLVRVKLQKQQTRFRVPVSVEERVGLAL